MQPMRLPDLTPTQRGDLDDLDRATRNVHLRARAQMVLLAADQHLTAAEIGVIVRVHAETVRRWLTRSRSEGIAGLHDAPHPGAPGKGTATYVAQLLAAVRPRPRALELPFSRWTLQRLADYLAAQTGIRVTHETVRRQLTHAGIVLSRPQHTITSPDPDDVLEKRRSQTPATSSKPEITALAPMRSIRVGGRRSRRCGVPRDSNS